MRLNQANLYKKTEKKSENHPKEKRSILSKIFGLKNNVRSEGNTVDLEKNISNEDNNLEKDKLQSLSNETVEEIKPEFEMIDDYNEYDRQTDSQNSKEDDLLQIPAFLRRQAN